MENINVIGGTILQIPRFIFRCLGNVTLDFFEDGAILPAVHKNRRGAPRVRPIDKNYLADMVDKASNVVVEAGSVFKRAAYINDIRQILRDHYTVSKNLGSDSVHNAVYLFHSHRKNPLKIVVRNKSSFAIIIIIACSLSVYIHQITPPLINLYCQDFINIIKDNITEEIPRPQTSFTLNHLLRSGYTDISRTC